MNIFLNKLNNISTILNFASKINIINLFLAKKLGLINWKTNIKASKIDNLLLNMYKIIIIIFWQRFNYLKNDVYRPKYI